MVLGGFRSFHVLVTVSRNWARYIYYAGLSVVNYWFRHLPANVTPYQTGKTEKLPLLWLG